MEIDYSNLKAKLDAVLEEMEAEEQEPKVELESRKGRRRHLRIQQIFHLLEETQDLTSANFLRIGINQPQGEEWLEDLEFIYRKFVKYLADKKILRFGTLKGKRYVKLDDL